MEVPDPVHRRRGGLRAHARHHAKHHPRRFDRDARRLVRPSGAADADNSDLLEELHRQDSQADGFLVGRHTFEALRGYWPEQTDDPTGISDYLNEVQKYVVSSTMTEPEWENSTVFSGDPVDEVSALKEQPGQDIVLTGSITLGHTLIDAGLVDEYRFFVYPVVQGRGRRLSRTVSSVPS